MGILESFPLIKEIISLIVTAVGKISESTFSTFLGVIIGAFVTAFKELIEELCKTKKGGEENSH